MSTVTPTVVIAIDKLNSYLENYRWVDPGFEFKSCIGNVRVIIHGNPSIDIRGSLGSVSKNFDILIAESDLVNKSCEYSNQFKYDLSWKDILQPHEYLHLARLDKLTQILRLSKYKDEHKLNHFDPVQTVYKTNPRQRNLRFGKDSGLIVAKPLHGARGIGQFVIDPLKCSINYFENSLGNLYAGISDATHRKNWLDHLKTIGVTYYPGGCKDEEEGYKALFEQGIVYQWVHDLKGKEYRVITDHLGRPAIYAPRQFRDDKAEYKQAIGSGSGRMLCEIPRTLSTVFNGNKTAMEQFERLCVDVIGPMRSVDLAITDNGKRFTIYEYCPQFGTDGLAEHDVVEVKADFIKSLVDQYLRVKHVSNGDSVGSTIR